MIDLLLGLPGKAKSIYDHLTTHLGSARMAKVDYLTAAVATSADLATLATNVANTGKLRSQIFTTSGTWTKPTNVSAVWVLLVGGGGGGGGAAPATYVGGAGGGGEVVSNFYIPVSGNVSVTVGASGSPGTYSGVAATAGGATIFSVVSAAGGGYGTNATSSVSGVSGAGGGITGGNTATSGTMWGITRSGGGGGSGVGSVGVGCPGFALNTAAAWKGGASYGVGAIVNTSAAANTGGGAGGANPGTSVGGTGGSGYAVVYWIE